MIRHLSADYVLPVAGKPIKNGIVSVDEKGAIVNLGSRDTGVVNADLVERFNGIIVPGFINAHCHLELSHLLGKVPPKQGLVSFIGQVIKLRSAEQEEIMEAMQNANEQMLANGIVAVGDISNSSVSKHIKSESEIYYHTFVEFLGFNPKQAASVYQSALNVLHEFLPLPASLAPHAPYSVSKDLLKMFQKNTAGRYEMTSIHNQESEDENELYRYKTGKFLDFYKALSIDIGFFRPQARNSIQSVIPLFAPNQKIMLVHNTYTSLKDIYFANRFNRDIHWCFCPKANLYIENRLPRMEMFQFPDFNIMLGTDSLASNDKLCILSELKTVKDQFPALPFTETLRWATLNGARFFGLDGKLGSIEPGKSPGLNLITNTEGLEITDDSEVQKII